VHTSIRNRRPSGRAKIRRYCVSPLGQPLCCATLGVMKYHEPLPMSRPELEASIESGNQTAITEALLSAAFYDADWRWVQGICLRFLDHTDPFVRWYAACCISHIARIHEVLDLDLVLTQVTFPKDRYGDWSVYRRGNGRHPALGSASVKYPDGLCGF